MKSKWEYKIGIVAVLIFLAVAIFFVKYVMHRKEVRDDRAPVTSYEVAVVEGSEQAVKSTITYYDKDLKEVGKQNFPYGGLCGSVEPVFYGDKVYLVPDGGQKTLSDIVLEIDVKTGTQKEYHMPESGLWDMEVDAENIYFVNNQDGCVYSFNKRNSNVGRVKLADSDFCDALALKDGILYAFGEETSCLYEIDVKTFSVVNKVDVSKYGEGVLGTCFYGEDLYIVFSQLGEDTELDYICSYSFATKKMRKIGLGVKEPLQIKKHKGLLYIVHSDMHDQENTSSSISIYNPKNGDLQNEMLDRHISGIDFKNEKMFLYGNNTFAIYSEDKNHKFVLEKEKDVYTQKNNRCYYWVSGFFLKR